MRGRNGQGAGVEERSQPLLQSREALVQMLHLLLKRGIGSGGFPF